MNLPPLSLPVFAVLVLFSGWFFGRFFDRIRLPPVLGMLAAGLLLGHFFSSRVPRGFGEWEPALKSFALLVILLRAGLGIRRSVLHRWGRVTLLLAFLPGLLEGLALIPALRLLFDFSWPAAGLTAFMLAAVSPAVIVPSMLNLEEKGWGRKNDVPTIILAGASVDDVFAITLFSVFMGLTAKEGASPVLSLLTVPLSLILGMGLGVLGGWLLALYFRRGKGNIRATEKTLLLFTAAILLVEVGGYLHAAALLGVMTLGFLLLEKAEETARELSVKLDRIWVIAQILLFVLIGFSVDLQVAAEAGLPGLGLLVWGLLFRSLGVMLAVAGSSLERKERLFCVAAYLPKATVQAALGGAALARGLPEGETILALAVLAILVTAPLGLFLIRSLAPRLLSVDLP